MQRDKSDKAVAVVLAAGEGRRMGGPKALLEYTAGQSFLDQLAEVFGAAGCEVVAVVGCEAARVRGAHPGLSCVENPGWREGGQLSSAKVGISAAVGRGARQILICPVDLPALLPSSVEAVRAGLADTAEAAVPVVGDERGHPLALTRSAAEQVLASGAEHLEAALRPLRVREVPVEDEGVLRDFDTSEEYQRFFGWPPRMVARAKP